MLDKIRCRLRCDNPKERDSLSREWRGGATGRLVGYRKCSTVTKTKRNCSLCCNVRQLAAPARLANDAQIVA